MIIVVKAGIIVKVVTIGDEPILIIDIKLMVLITTMARTDIVVTMTTTTKVFLMIDSWIRVTVNVDYLNHFFIIMAVYFVRVVKVVAIMVDTCIKAIILFIKVMAINTMADKSVKA